MRFSAFALLCGIVALPVLVRAQPVVIPLASSDTYCRVNGQTDYLIGHEEFCEGVYVVKVNPPLSHVTYCAHGALSITGQNRSSIVYECNYESGSTIYRIFECKNPVQMIKNRGVATDRNGMYDAVRCENPPNLRTR